MTRVRRWLVRAGLVTAAVLVGLGAAEAALRALPRDRYGFFVLVPGTSRTITGTPNVFPGVHGESHYTVNRFGIRGRLFGADSSEYRILAVGASTTECANLDDSEAWPQVLETALSRTGDGRAVWVGNVGRSGLTTRDNVLHLKYLLHEYPRIDAVVALVGVNDMQAALAQAWHYHEPEAVTDSAEERLQLPRSFAGVPFSAVAPALPWYEVTELWRLVRRAKLALDVRRSYKLTVLSPSGWLDWRDVRRRTRRRIDSLPPLGAPLAEYRRNLNAMVDNAETGHARLVLVTQPSLWSAHPSAHLDSLLWFGWVGPDRRSPEGYFTPGAMERAMRAFNATVLQVCRDRGIECVDAGRELSRDSSVFFDDVHFSERGAQRLSGELATWFRARAPFRRTVAGLPRRADSSTIGRSRPQPSP